MIEILARVGTLCIDVDCFQQDSACGTEGLIVANAPARLRISTVSPGQPDAVSSPGLQADDLYRGAES